MSFAAIRGRFYSRFFAIMLASIGLAGCKAKQRYPSHGLRSFEFRMKSEDAGGLYGGAYDHVEYPATVLIDGEEFSATVSGAGSSTVRSPRKSFNVKLKKGKFRGAKEFRLAGLVSDRTKIRPLLALEVFEAAGVPASWSEPAFLYLNDRILGLYVAIEKIEEEFFERRDIPWEAYISAEGDADFKPGFEGRIDAAFSGRPKPANLEPMVALYRTLSIESDSEFENAVFRILDRESVIAYMTASTILNHFDGFNKNLFYYRALGSTSMKLIPWDFDLVWAMDRTGVPTPWHLNRLFSRIGDLPSASSEIASRVATLVGGSLSETAVLARVDFWKERIAEAYAIDPFLGRGGLSIDDEIENLKDAIRAWYARL